MAVFLGFTRPQFTVPPTLRLGIPACTFGLVLQQATYDCHGDIPSGPMRHGIVNNLLRALKHKGVVDHISAANQVTALRRMFRIEKSARYIRFWNMVG